VRWAVGKAADILVDHMKIARKMDLLMALSAGRIVNSVDLSVHAKLIMKLRSGLADTRKRKTC
jgi:hypothetical protein